MTIQFTAHNIKLDDGTFTKPDKEISIDTEAWFQSAKRILETVFPRNKHSIRLADLGCLEGGFAVEFARMGFQVLGIDVREDNITACNYVKSRTNLPNLEFIKDDVFNLDKYGFFDAVFCCGLLYHLDKPKEFLEKISRVTTKLVILQTHFAIGEANLPKLFRFLPASAQKELLKLVTTKRDRFALSEPGINEGLAGRWYTEFSNDEEFSNREAAKWASWDNRRSFWIQREYLLQAIQDVGFDLVLEQFDSLGPNIAEAMQTGYYFTDNRGTFIGIKTA